MTIKNKIILIVISFFIISSLIFFYLYVREKKYSDKLENNLKDSINVIHKHINIDSTAIFEGNNYILKLNNIIANKDKIINEKNKEILSLITSNNNTTIDTQFVEVYPIIDTTLIDIQSYYKELQDSTKLSFNIKNELNFKVQVDTLLNQYFTHKNNVSISNISIEYNSAIIHNYDLINKKRFCDIFISSNLGILNVQTLLNNTIYDNSKIIGPSIGISALWKEQLITGVTYSKEMYMFNIGYRIWKIEK